MLITPPPYLECCAEEGWKKNGMHELVKKWWTKLPAVYQKVAKDTGVKLLDLQELYKGKP